MHVTAIDQYLIDGGLLTEWTLAPVAEPVRSAVPPSYNQRFHLATARAQGVGRSVWMAGSFDVPSPLDKAALRRTLELVIRRHDALWTGFEVLPDRIERLMVPLDQIALATSTPVEIEDPGLLRKHLRTRFTAVCDPLTFPAFLFATVEREESCTVIAAFDHTIVDGYSLVIAIRELREIYQLIQANPEISDEQVNAALGDPGSFMKYCEAEVEEPDVDPADRRIRAWGRFYEKCGGTSPSFPLKLGVKAGKPVAQASDVRPILDGVDAARFERACLAAGGTMFTGVLTALGTAQRLEGGVDALPVVFPLHTRQSAEWENAIGWLTTAAPIVIEVGDATDFGASLANTHASFRSALTLKGVSMPQVKEALGDGFRRTRTDVFMVSYIDYRRLAGTEHHREMNAHHISNVTVCDDAQFWVSRTDEGLALRSRYPDTRAARRTVERFLKRLTAVMKDVSVNGIPMDHFDDDLVFADA